jgi:hypothetical protein
LRIKEVRNYEADTLFKSAARIRKGKERKDARPLAKRSFLTVPFYPLISRIGDVFITVNCKTRR